MDKQNNDQGKCHDSFEGEGDSKRIFGSKKKMIMYRYTPTIGNFTIVTTKATPRMKPIGIRLYGDPTRWMTRKYSNRTTTTQNRMLPSNENSCFSPHQWHLSLAFCDPQMPFVEKGSHLKYFLLVEKEKSESSHRVRQRSQHLNSNIDYRIPMWSPPIKK